MSGISNIRRPVLTDERYSGLSTAEASREYERDLLLYEQAVAMQQLIIKQNFEENFNDKNLVMYNCDDIDEVDDEIAIKKYEKRVSKKKQIKQLESAISDIKYHSDMTILCTVFIILLAICNIPMQIIPNTIAVVICTLTPFIIELYYYLTLNSLKKQLARLKGKKKSKK